MWNSHNIILEVNEIDGVQLTIYEQWATLKNTIEGFWEGWQLKLVWKGCHLLNFSIKVGRKLIK